MECKQSRDALGKTLKANRRYRIIRLHGAINLGLGQLVKKAIRQMNNDNRIEPIWFYLCSSGGNVREEEPILRAMDVSAAPVILIGFQRVASAALTIFQGGVARYALAGTKFIFHQACTIVPIEKKCNLMVKARDYLKMFHALKRADAITLRELSRNIETRKAEVFLAREAEIGVAQAIKLGMVEGYFDRKEFLRDQRRLSK